MNIGKFRVHRAQNVAQQVTVQFEGQEIPATVGGIEVELTPETDPRMGTITLRFVGGSASEAAPGFMTDGVGMLVWIPDPVEPMPAAAAEAVPETATVA